MNFAPNYLTKNSATSAKTQSLSKSGKPGEDCFANRERYCAVLITKKCKGCSFYKTHAQYKKGLGIDTTPEMLDGIAALKVTPKWKETERKTLEAKRNCEPCGEQGRTQVAKKAMPKDSSSLKTTGAVCSHENAVPVCHHCGGKMNGETKAAQKQADINYLAENDTKRSVPSAFIALREKRGMTQADLASNAGVAMNTITRLESGKGLPSIESTYLIATVLGISLHEFSELLRSDR